MQIYMVNRKEKHLKLFYCSSQYKIMKENVKLMNILIYEKNQEYSKVQKK